MIGRRLGQYEIRSLLGIGGMGEVYLARDTRLDRDVAIKLLPAEATQDNRLRQRLEQEARAIASLHHPNIVTLYSVEEDQDRLFLVMELALGPPLSESLPSTGVGLSRFLELALPLTDAVGAAHAKGIVHRDLKPSNIVIDETGRLKVLDFGLAKRLESASPLEEETAQMDLTKAGTIVGTCAYMSPEQARGEDVGVQSDVFSLGIILYEMACGRRPFTGNNPISILSSILRDDPVPVQEMEASVPPRVAQLIMRCLERDPRQRWASAVELHQELARVKHSMDSGELVTTGTTSRFGRRNIARWVVLLLLLVAVLGFLGWKYRTSGHAPSVVSDTSVSASKVIVVFPFENLGEAKDDYFSDGMTDEIVSRLTSVPGIGVISRTTAMRYERAGKSLDQIAVDLGVEFVLEGTVRWERSSAGDNRVRITPQLVRVADQVSVWSQIYDREVRDVFAIQSDIARQVVDNIDATLMPVASAQLEPEHTENLEAYDAYLQAKQLMQWGVGPGETQLRSAAELLEKAIALDANFADAYASLSRVRSALAFRGFDASGTELGLSERAADRALQLAPESVEAHLAKGLFYYRGDRRYARALEELEIARRLAPGSGEVLSWIGTVRKRQGRFEDAVRILQQASRLDPYNPFISTELSVVHRSLGEFETAVEDMDRVIALTPTFEAKLLRARIIEAWKGDLEPQRMLLMASGSGHEATWENLYSKERRFDEALAVLDSISVDSLAAPEQLSRLEMRRAWLYWALGETEKAHESAARAIPLLENMTNLERNPVENVAVLGLAYALQGRADEAVAQAELAVQSAPLSRDALQSPDVMVRAARVHAVLGDATRAVALLEKAARNNGMLTVHALELDSSWDSIRHTTEFEALVKRLGQAQ